jgi:hypothetical protein
MKVFILAGQSNMQGCGNLSPYPQQEDIRLFNFKDNKWEKAKEPLHPYACKIWTDGGAGLAMSFGLRILEKFPEWEIGFIPCAVSGSRLDQWLPGAELFERAITKTTQALSACDAKLAGILWHQGEADSKSLEFSKSYGERFELIINAFRERLGYADLPVIAGELGKFLIHNTDYPYYKTVNNALKEVSTVLATSENLSDNDRNDNTHFDTISLREFGVRYAESYLNLQEKENV